MDGFGLGSGLRFEVEMGDLLICQIEIESFHSRRTAE